jgi:TRAP-type mannitol/chloroaromatic compound transport system substrate-binding protein
VTVFGGYFPLGLRYSLDVPALFNKYGLKAIWEEEYAKVGVKHISAGAWDPCHFATKDPINSLADLQGKRVFTFPTAGRFLTQFGVVPVTLPWEDIEVAMQTGELDGIAWSGITERDQLLPHEQHLGCLDWPLLRQYGPLERPAAASAGNARHLL